MAHGSLCAWVFGAAEGSGVTGHGFMVGSPALVHQRALTSLISTNQTTLNNSNILIYNPCT